MSRVKITPAGVEEQLHDVLAWFATADARSAARSELRMRRLPAHLEDDLLQEAALGVAATFSRRGQPYPELRPAAFARRVLKNHAISLLRGVYRSPVVVPEHPAGDEDLIADLAAADDVADTVADKLMPAAEDACRDEVARQLALSACEAWVGAATLTELTLILHDVDLPTDVPQPAAGAGESEGRRWAALFYAGQRSCFEGPAEGHDAAVRQRRSRAGKQVGHLLGVVVRAALAEHNPGERLPAGD